MDGGDSDVSPSSSHATSALAADQRASSQTVPHLPFNATSSIPSLLSPTRRMEKSSSSVSSREWGREKRGRGRREGVREGKRGGGGGGGGKGEWK